MAIIQEDSSGQLWQVAPGTDGSLLTTATTSDLAFSNKSYARDAAGQLWELTIGTDGSLTTTQVADTADNVVVQPVSPQMYLRDSDGQLWKVSINSDGSFTTTPVTDALTPDNGDGCTVSLQSVVNLCQTHVDLMPLASVGGFSQEPALSLANDTLQELCSKPYDWKFNSAETGLLATHPYRQDYLFAGASAFVIGQSSAGIGLADGAAITMNGNEVTVKCLQPHGFTVGQTVYMSGNTLDVYNSTRVDSAAGGWTGGWVITDASDPKVFKFNHTLSNQSPSGAPGITDFGWLESAVMYDTASTEAAPYQWEVEAIRTQKKTNAVGRPRKVSVQSVTAGIALVRFSHIGTGTIYAVTLRYQKKPPLKTDLTQTWAPFPDELGFVYRQMFLARCYRYLDKPRADNEEMKAQTAILKALGRDDVEESDQYVAPERSLMDGDYAW